MSTNKGEQVQSRSKKGRGYPNPDPKIPISARLERVRAEFGYRSKRAFWEKLCDGWTDSLSYEAIRNYHYDREPPPSYLSRVLEVFSGVRAEWLLTGEEPMTEQEKATAETSGLNVRARINPALNLRDAVLQAAGRSVPESNIRFGGEAPEYWPAWVPALMAVSARRSFRALVEVAYELKEDGRSDNERLADAVVAPLFALGITQEELADWSENEFTDHVLAMVPVLRRLGSAGIPKPIFDDETEEEGEDDGEA